MFGGVAPAGVNWREQ